MVVGVIANYADYRLASGVNSVSLTLSETARTVLGVRFTASEQFYSSKTDDELLALAAD